MLNNRVLSYVLTISVISSFAAFSAEASTAKASHPAVQQVSLTKDQKKTIIKECKESNKADKKAYKACIVEKKKAAEGSTTKM